MPRPRDDRPLYYGLLRVRAEKDGRLVPLWYGVGEESDWDQMTVVGGEYTIAFCGLPHARSLEDARDQLKRDLSWFKPLLCGASPEPWFASERGQFDAR